jgi:hypothetical protein
VDVGAFDDGTIFNALVRSRKDGFKWEVMVVYGPAQHERSESFLEELSEKCKRTIVCMLIACDFNFIKGRGDTNNNNIDW